MNWRQEEVTVAGEPAVRVYNGDNDVEFMCGDWWDATKLIVALKKFVLDMHVPDFGYEFPEFQQWKEAEDAKLRAASRIAF